MTVSSVSGQDTSSYTGKSATDQASLNTDFDQFLRLLTTQLQNQDPLSPMDSTEFTNQLVNFSGVEQQIKSNDTLSKLLSVQSLNLTALGLSFIGKDVEVQGSSFSADGTKSLNVGYIMPTDVKTGTISILDENGKVVHTENADLTAGRHNFTWDGKDENGDPVPAGKYEVRVAALNANKAAQTVTTFVPGHVDSLESLDDGSLVLIVDGEQVPLSDVRKVSEHAA